MSQLKVPDHTRRLANLVVRPGGVTEAEAVEAATANLETIRDRTLLELDAIVQQMQQLGAGLQRPAAAELEQLYTLSNTVVGIAGVFGLSGVSAVAYSLCELIDRLRTSRTWNSRALIVHLDSMRLMQAETPGSQQEMEIREALRRVVDRVPVSSD